MNLDLTEAGNARLRTVIENYPKLAKFYVPQLGNFEFTEEEFNSHESEINRFLAEFSEFKIVPENDYLYLTDFFE